MKNYLFSTIAIILCLLMANGCDPMQQETVDNTHIVVNAPTKTALTYEECLALRGINASDCKLTDAEAFERVASFAANNADRCGKLNLVSCKLQGNTKDPAAYYEIEFTGSKGRGYSIVAADARIQDIICFVEQGSLSDTTNNEGLKHYFRHIQHYLKDNISSTNFNTVRSEALNKVAEFPSTKVIPPFDPDVWTYSHTVVDSTVTQKLRYVPVKWGPYYPMNSLINGTVGCATVAVAQLMTYYKYTYNNIGTSTWNAIIANPYSHTSIPYLFRDIRNDLGESPTVANIRSFLNNVNYSAGSVNNGYSFSVIMSALTYGPTIIGGHPSGDLVNGHCWIVDGVYERNSVTYDVYTLEYNGDLLEYYVYYPSYSTQRNHFNWGFEGVSDGWFASGVLDQDQAIEYDDWGSSGSEPTYDYWVRIISSIQ